MIDAHHHLWDLNAVHYPWILDETPRFFGDHAPIRRNYLLPELRSDARRHGGTGSVHIQVGAADPMEEAAWVDLIARDTPSWPMVQVAFADLTAPGRDRALDALGRLPSVVGVRQIVGRSPAEDAATGTNDLLQNPAFLDGLQAVAARGWRFDLQLIPELMPATAAILRQVPELPVALCHAGSPHNRTPDGLRDWASALQELSALPNVTCKLSGLGMFDHSWTPERLTPIVDTLLEQFGPDRLMFGSNFPVCSLSSDYTTLVWALLDLVPKDAHDAVFHATAARFYGLH